MGITASFRRRRGLLVVVMAAAGSVLWAPQAVPADTDGRGAVYVQTNTAPVNYVQVFDRNKDGTLTTAGRYPTGGVGRPGGNPPMGIPFLDTAGSVTLSDNGKSLFVVNAGNNTVSSFRVDPKGLTLADVESTNGLRPISSTSHHHLLYVLNSETAAASIFGYQVEGNGELTPIPGSLRPTFQSAGGLPAQVQFDSKGRFLAVTERLAAGGAGLIDTFPIDNNGVAGPAVAHPSSDRTPFGVAFTHDDLMIVSNEHAPDIALSSVSSYDTSKDGDTVTPIDTELTHSGAACWNVITSDDEYVFVTSPFTFDVNAFRIEKGGELTPVNGTSQVAHAQALTLDEALSHDSKYLYVLVSNFFGSDVVNEYAVNKDGTITLIGMSTPFEGTAAGAAAW
jgi:6-phosphogluconolactonase